MRRVWKDNKSVSRVCIPPTSPLITLITLPCSLQPFTHRKKMQMNIFPLWTHTAAYDIDISCRLPACPVQVIAHNLYPAVRAVVFTSGMCWAFISIIRDCRYPTQAPSLFRESRSRRFLSQFYSDVWKSQCHTILPGHKAQWLISPLWSDYFQMVGTSVS